MACIGYRLSIFPAALAAGSTLSFAFAASSALTGSLAGSLAALPTAPLASSGSTALSFGAGSIFLWHEFHLLEILVFCPISDIVAFHKIVIDFIYRFLRLNRLRRCLPLPRISKVPPWTLNALPVTRASPTVLRAVARILP